MAVDTPARIVVIGAGPIGLEAALYARFLGYWRWRSTSRGRVADNIVQATAGDGAMATPWRMNVTSLGLAALRAQDTLWKPPSGDALLTGREWAAQYLVPLSQTDLPWPTTCSSEPKCWPWPVEDARPAANESTNDEDEEDGGER